MAVTQCLGKISLFTNTLKYKDLKHADVIYTHFGFDPTMDKIIHGFQFLMDMQICKRSLASSQFPILPGAPF